MVHSRSSSLQRHREVQRSETSPLAPPRKDWGSRSRPPLCSCQCRRINLSLTATASRSQVPNSSSWSSRSSSGARPPYGEFGQTAQAYLPVSIWPPDSDLNCPAAYCASGPFRLPRDEHFLRHSSFRDRVKVLGSCEHGPFMMAFKAHTHLVLGPPDRTLECPTIEVPATQLLRDPIQEIQGRFSTSPLLPDRGVTTRDHVTPREGALEELPTPPPPPPPPPHSDVVGFL